MEQLHKIFLEHPTISTDSRNISEGSIFFALKGANFDGNIYASKALEAGASFAVVDNRDYALDYRYIVVDDALETLQELANFHRHWLGIIVIAISGSNGKTTTKELLLATLSKKYKTQATEGNLNNHIGVPLTLLKLKSKTQIAIIEMGASAKGEIAQLCNIAQPNYGLLTNVGRAHLEGFGGEQGVRIAKGELFDYLQQHNGVAFYREQDPILAQMISLRQGLKAVAYSPLEINFKSQLEGEYNNYNIAAASAIASYFMVEPAEISDAIEGYCPKNNRSQRQVTKKNTIIIDCYNANPSSMQSALDNFTKQDGENKIAVLGDMFELGIYSRDEHIKVLKSLENSDVKRVITVGQNFITAKVKFTPKTYELKSYPDTETVIKNEIFENSLILLKGSRGTALEKIIPYL